MKYIQIKTKEHFREIMNFYEKPWKDWMWNYFIDLEKAKKLGTEL